MGEGNAKSVFAFSRCGIDGATLLAEILQSAPEVKLLVTSQERLNLHREWCYVDGLPYPPSDTDEGPANCGAVHLFWQTARRANRHFALQRNAVAIARICRLVEGMPLAVELAATRTTTHTCEEIAEEIERHLGFLAAPCGICPTVTGACARPLSTPGAC